MSGFFSRLKTIIKGKANEQVDKLEEKNLEAVVHEEIRNMKNEFREAKSAVAKSITLVKEAESRYSKAEEEKKHWENRAKQALEAGDEDLAKKAIEKKQEAEKDFLKYQEQVKKRRRIADAHKKKVKELQERIEEAEDRKEELLAAAANAKATKEINETMSGLGKTSAADNLDRFEKKVDTMEAEAEASEELYEDLKENDLESQFEELEKNDTVDDELARLKAEMGKNE
ncbi:MAG: PspA/IM30 family protein [Bacillota bacterium]